MNSSNQTTRVLIVEDNPVDVHLVRLALEEEHTWPTESVVTADGEKAIDFLLRQGSFANAEPPHLVILDLNLPKRDGTEVLQVIRTTDSLQNLAVAILSSSPKDLIRSKVHSANVEANCYFTKPVDADAFLALGRAIRRCYEKSRPPQVSPDL